MKRIVAFALVLSAVPAHAAFVAFDVPGGGTTNGMGTYAYGVNADGSVHDKAAILASAKKNAGSTARRVADEKWLAAHPMGTAALTQGDTAIVTFYLKPLGPEKGIMSSDIFVYRDGQWHAIYSQHTDAGK